MLLTPSEISSTQLPRNWFCLRTQPKREHIAAACLRQVKEVEVFCPRLRLKKRTRRGPVWFVEAMFPGYLFARLNYNYAHRIVRQKPGVTGFVQFGERLALLPERLVAELQRYAGEGELLQVDPALETGSTVSITHGPLQGLEALVTRIIDARDRVQILIDWMGRTMQAEIDLADLLPATKSASGLGN